MPPGYFKSPYAQGGAIVPSLTAHSCPKHFKSISAFVFAVADLENNSPPRARAGGHHVLVLPNNCVTLDGSRSTDDQGVVSYLWVRDGQSPAAGVSARRELSCSHHTESVCSGCCKEVPPAGRLPRQTGMSPALEPVKSKVKALGDLAPGQSSLFGSRVTAFSLCPHTAEREGSLVSPLQGR